MLRLGTRTHQALKITVRHLPFLTLTRSLCVPRLYTGIL